MESFGFLKYLRGNQRAPVPATTIAASACEDGGGDVIVDDDASFFDLEFAVPGGDESAASDADEDRVEFNFAVAGDDAALPGAEVVESGDEQQKDGAEAAEVAPPPPASLLRVLLLKLRKPPRVPVPAEGNGGAPAAKASRFLIKFWVDDAPLVSLFTRDNSSRTSDAGGERPAVQGAQPQDAAPASAAITAEERRFAKEVLLRYLNKIRPLYVKVSRLRFPGGSEGDEETDAEAADPSSPAPQQVVVACGVRAPRASVPAGLKQVCKRLGKSRSASSAVAAAPSPGPPPGTPQPQPQPQRRDDSLLQVQDGIQSAIAHCKRSFNASKGSESPLLRSMTTSDGSKADTTDGGDGA